MKTEFYFFSGTGNSYYIAKKLSESLTDVQLIPINTLDLSKEVESTAEIIGIIFPVYFLDAPDIVKHFIKRLKIPNSSYTFLFENYGGMGGNSLSNCAKILADKDIKVSHTFSLALPDNSIIFPISNDSVKPLLAEAEEKLKAAAHIIHLQQTDSIPKKKLGISLLSSIMIRFGKSYLGFNDLKVNSSKCNGCGLCTKVCPMKNIELSQKIPVFKDKCEMCFACVHHCPKESIKFRKMKAKNHYQYTNPYISLNEMIEKNK
ncbi:MAG: hypothetical protein K0S71_2898 [Clostridia bacterium]|jgi:ferredoxin|nr:hypothetical protein [Clostridia bacterium]